MVNTITATETWRTMGGLIVISVKDTTVYFRLHGMKKNRGNAESIFGKVFLCLITPLLLILNRAGILFLICVFTPDTEKSSKNASIFL